jgi:hypothetical protein
LNKHDFHTYSHGICEEKPCFNAYHIEKCLNYKYHPFYRDAKQKIPKQGESSIVEATTFSEGNSLRCAGISSPVEKIFDKMGL